MVNAAVPGAGPGTGFAGYGYWEGYCEGMMIYLLGMGTAYQSRARCRLEPLDQRIYLGYQLWRGLYPVSSTVWVQYSQCWVDFRHIADAYMNSHNSTYFENSRRAPCPAVVLHCRPACLGGIWQ